MDEFRFKLRRILSADVFELDVGVKKGLFIVDDLDENGDGVLILVFTRGEGVVMDDFNLDDNKR